jgi:hypothetical protein
MAGGGGLVTGGGGLVMVRNSSRGLIMVRKGD